MQLEQTELVMKGMEVDGLKGSGVVNGQVCVISKMVWYIFYHCGYW